MLEQLFGSKTRVKILRVFFREPERAFFVRELGRAVDAQINAVRRELELLIDVDLIQEVDIPKKIDTSKAGAALRKYYSLNSESILYPEMQALLVKAQSMGQQQFIEDLKKKIGTPELIVLTGLFTGDRHAQTDILVVGDIKTRSLDRLIKKYEKDSGAEVRYTTMDLNEFFDRRHMMDKFLYSIFESVHTKVVDVLDK
jgi:hypothetical protein